MTMFKRIHGLAPSYLGDDCVAPLASSVADRRHLRSAYTRTLALRRTKNCHRHQEVCCFHCCHVGQLTPGTTNNVLSTNLCAKTQETPVYRFLLAHLRIFLFRAIHMYLLLLLLLKHISPQ